MAKTQSPAPTRSLSPNSAQGKSSRPKSFTIADVGRWGSMPTIAASYTRSVGHAALHRVCRTQDDVEIGSGRSRPRDGHARSAALPLAGNTASTQFFTLFITAIRT